MGPSWRPIAGTRPERAVAAQVAGGRGQFLWHDQGVFVGAPLDGSGKGGFKVLPYGATIIVRGTACTSLPSGIPGTGP
ncbi:hypothetical protein ABZ540_31245 [Nocardia xishanensis]|uniref:hypothetical protein n=1 Tax=Nocardia xishanensis TaxID=238964 RepID=UPI00340C01D7